MSERLPPPTKAQFPPPDDSYLRTLPAGTLLGRIYAAGGAYPAAWRTFRAYGPTGSRFDHQPPPPKVHARRRVMYAAAALPNREGVTYPVLKTTLAEVFRDRGVVELRRDDPYFVMFRLERDVRLLGLSDTDWVTVAGGNAAITSGVRSQSRSWARAIYSHYGVDVDGVHYAPSNVPPARAVALWEQAEDALPARPVFNEPLAHPGLRARLDAYAGELGLRVL